MASKQRKISFLRSLTILIPSWAILKAAAAAAATSSSSLETLCLEGHSSFQGTHQAAGDFGKLFRHPPSAVLHPKSATDVAAAVKHVWELGPASALTVAARGSGHSVQGQSQAEGGVVILMESFRGGGMQVRGGGTPYVDAPGGELWINVLHECLNHGLAPKSWTDYLHLSVGGTLSNAGVGGQTFRHGPQISNVLELDVVTGKGELVRCSEEEKQELFHGVLGGLGQFGIITRARISLQPSPERVKWIRVLYSDFSTFTRDQESLISPSDDGGFDYVEGFVIINRTGLLDSWISHFKPRHPAPAGRFRSEGRTLFCLEVTKNFNTGEADAVNAVVERRLSRLSYIAATLLEREASYVEFLDRVHISEVKLSFRGLWEVPHPWLNLLVPRTQIHGFAAAVFGDIVRDTGEGPIILYPMNKSKWDGRTSAVIPEEEVFYLVAFLSSSPEADGVERIVGQNQRILELCAAALPGVKQYLPYFSSPEEWRSHFGRRWEAFVRMKSEYDPLAILAPGHRIFGKPLST